MANIWAKVENPPLRHSTDLQNVCSSLFGEQPIPHSSLCPLSCPAGTHLHPVWSHYVSEAACPGQPPSGWGDGNWPCARGHGTGECQYIALIKKLWLSEEGSPARWKKGLGRGTSALWSRQTDGHLCGVIQLNKE